MHKKLMLACMAIAAFAAFVIAPAASASPVLTSTPSGTVPVGTSITGVNTGETIFTGSVEVRCDHDHLTGTVTENSGSSIKGTIPVGGAKFNGTGTNTDCTSNLFGAPAAVSVNSELCLETVTKTDNVTITGCAGAKVAFTLNITGSGPCKYETATVLGTFTTVATGDATINVSEQAANGVVGNGPFCPSSGKLDMDFDLYTTNGVALAIS